MNQIKAKDNHFFLLKAGLFPNKINIIKSLYLTINLSLIQADHKIENSYEKYIFKYNKEKFILVVPPPPHGLVHRLLRCSGWLISVINVWLQWYSTSGIPVWLLCCSG